MPSPIRYNERAWAIDVISEINSYCRTTVRAIARAGGEYSLRFNRKSMFPDVLLFSDNSGSSVLQGWELKMPDTSITDGELIENAKIKAKRLRLNSFLVWNGSDAALYRLSGESSDSEYEVLKNWSTASISSRDDVYQNPEIWKAKLREILDVINDLSENRDISTAMPEFVINENLFTDFLDSYESISSEFLELSSRRNNTLKEKIDLWWAENEKEYDGASKFNAIARINLINWINRFLFSHYLKTRHSYARVVDDISDNTSIAQASDVFLGISNHCDFINVFRSDNIGQKVLSKEVWKALIGINRLLKDFKLTEIPQESLQGILDRALIFSRRKLAGQFTTPETLAELAVRITVEDWTDHIIDPCCGTGTIARSIYKQKRLIGLNPSESLKTTWSSDKYTFPLNLCSISLSDRDAMGEIVQVFKKDAFELYLDDEEPFTNPSSGNIETRQLQAVHAVVSNLPFVRFEDATKLNPLLISYRDNLNSSLDNSISAKVDLYVYLVFRLGELLKDRGRMGVIVSNSWLGADWGKPFRDALLKKFIIRRVVISGRGRWFSNAEVVTTILVLEKRPAGSLIDESEIIDFSSTQEPIEEWDSQEVLDSLVQSIVLPSLSTSSVERYSYTLDQIYYFETLGLSWSALFANLSWIGEIVNFLIPVRDFFEIARGERRGCNALFYPRSRSSVESQFIRPVLKTSRGLSNLMAEPNAFAFCCSLSIDQLEEAGCDRALELIRRFNTLRNRTKLRRSGMLWYEMKPNTMADLVLSMNPDKKLIVYRLNQRSFVDQRLIRFTALENVDVDICHALLNSTIGMFLIQAAGFGRGMGALDLNAGKMKHSYHMLNPRLLSSDSRQLILTAFQPLLARNTVNLLDELEMPDRLAFDRVVLDAFNIPTAILSQLYDSLKKLYQIRMTARS